LPVRYALEGTRADLAAADEILALMAQDLNDLRRESASVTHADLLALGWTAQQVKTHFQPALEEAFRTYCETASDKTASLQATPFLTFDAGMKQQLARATLPTTHFFEAVELPAPADMRCRLDRPGFAQPTRDSNEVA
jgi:hypothetical protein